MYLTSRAHVALPTDCTHSLCRGRERSRPAQSILDEVKRLRDAGVRQVTLLGQNVNSYADFSDAAALHAAHAPDTAATPMPGSTGHGGVSAANLASPGEAYAFAPYAAGFQSVYKPRRDGAVVFSELLRRYATSAVCVQGMVLHVMSNFCHALHLFAMCGQSSSTWVPPCNTSNLLQGRRGGP